MIEMVEKRTRNSKTYSLGGNRYSCDVSIGAIHYKDNPRDKTEEWKDIDTTISSDGKVRKAPYDLDVYLTGMPGFHYKSKESGEFDIRLKEARIGTEVSKTVVPPDMGVKPIIKGNQVIWNNIYPNTDVVLIAGNTSVTLKRILKSVRSPLEYDMDIRQVASGVATLRSVRIARDSCGRDFPMREKGIEDGRTETLNLECQRCPKRLLSGEPEYPIEDATEVNEQVGDGADDAGVVCDALWGTTRAHLDWGCCCGSFSLYGGIRFQTVNVPKGATITTAYLELYGDTGGSCSPTSTSALIEGEDTDDAAAFTSLDNYNGRTRTSASVAWTPGSWSYGDWNTSAEIKTIIQEIVNRGGWAANNDLVIFLGDNSNPSGRRISAYTYDYDDNTKGPKLHIEYETGVEVTPTPVSAVSTSVAPGVVLGSITITAAAVEAIVRSVAPFIEGGIQILFIVPSMDTGLTIESKLSTGLSLTKIFKQALEITPTTKER